MVVFDVAPCGASRPWIFFINGVLCFLKFNGSRMKKDDWIRHYKEKMSQEEAHHYRKPWIRAWRRRRWGEGEGEKEHEILCLKEVWTLKCNSQMIKVPKKCTHVTSIYSLSVTQNWREIWISIQISLEFEIEFVEPNFGAKISLIMISEF